MSTIKIKKADGSVIIRKESDWQRNMDNWKSRGWTIVEEKTTAKKVEKPLVLTEEVKPAKKKKKSKK
tara:strand:+ start:3656 stop:3856 length:201 start_codon:yes stop_codon:yes gene_type:complete